MPPTSDVLSRFHQVLLQEISESRPEYLTQPFTVAEIYQNLVPYRSHRDLIGVEMNGDYEDALLRLLAGEGDYLVIDSEVARREIREELESPSPNTGLFRDFAAADVRLNPAHLLTGAGDASGEPSGEAIEDEDATSPDEIGADGPAVLDDAESIPDEDDIEDQGEDDVEDHGEDDVEDHGEDHVEGQGEDWGEVVSDGVVGHIELADDGVPVSVASTEPDHEDPRSEDAPSISSAEDVEVAGEAEEHGEHGEEALEEADGPAACHWCRQSLPSRQVLNFCPFCGSDMRLFPCPKCGEELELDWQFCVSCGTEVSE